MSRPLELINDINDRKDVWKIAVKIHHKWKVTTTTKEHFEMVVGDKNGHDIHVVVPTIYKQAFDSVLSANVTCTMSNFHVHPNDLLFKPTTHKYLLKFTAGTTVADIGKHTIPDRKINFTPFADIISGKWQKNLLCDVIGVVDEVGYSQSSTGGKKPQINLVLRDSSDNTLHCTLWEHYANEFFEYKQKAHDQSTPTIILLKYAKVKEEGKFPLAVTNTYNVTTIHINDDLPEINDFIKSLPKGTNYGKALAATSSQTRDSSHMSYGSQLSATDKCLSKSIQIQLNEIIQLYQPTVCVTVATTDKLIASPNGWCYRACHQCPQAAEGDIPPFVCRDGHRTEAEIWRYKIEIGVVQDGSSTIFVFWDEIAAHILESSAAQLRSTMLEAGITDPLDFPLALDGMLGLKLAFKVKWNPRWKSCSVVQFLKDEQLIKQLEGPLAIDQADKLCEGDNQLIEASSNSMQILESVGEDVTFEKLNPVTWNNICLTVATSGITSLLLPGGRTTHSRFKIPVPTLDNSTCNITYKEEAAELLRQAKLIIWDEAPMANKWCFEALDKILKDVMSSYSNSTEVFGGKVVVFGGDFRQILSVIPRGSRSDIVHATINSSYIWNSVQVLTLTRNMRLSCGPTVHDRKEIAVFSDWLLKIGEGKIGEPNDGTADIEFPPDMLITEFDDPIVAIVSSTYPAFFVNYKDFTYLKSRAILASTIEMVDKINDHVLAIMPGDLRDYYSCNSVDRSEIHDRDILDVLTPKFLSSLKTSGLPNHHIKLKIGAPIMLMRNIDQSEGLCNGTRLIVSKMATHVLEAHIMGGNHHGNVVYIPRMDMSPSQSPWPFKLSRRQFPVIVSYAMTINKSQGQSLDWVGLYIPREVFTHGQIYVALSRVTSKKGIKVLIHDENNNAKSSTTKVVYKEVFNNV